MPLEFTQVLGGKVGQLHMLEVAPEPLVGVEFRCVGRQGFDGKAGAMLTDEVLHGFGFVGVEIVPDKDDMSANVAKQMAQEDQDLGRCDTSPADEDEKAPVEAHARDCRELRPGISMKQNGSLSARGPSPHPGGNKPETTFVGENQGGSESACFFLMRGQSLATQRRTASSSRSRARLTGRWNDQPHWWSNLGI